MADGAKSSYKIDRRRRVCGECRRAAGLVHRPARRSRRACAAGAAEFGVSRAPAAASSVSPRHAAPATPLARAWPARRPPSPPKAGRVKPCRADIHSTHRDCEFAAMLSGDSL
ncbi:unnamed protein product [Pieris macdunnoughi]|uniref:Uncharacterized protein n=1 Tax=Pieris macdunnoughi TaxID=345717 RepID=A0A821SG56_9NEOP|nr:unnamed protein product [Pieris macdunnoughi]